MFSSGSRALIILLLASLNALAFTATDRGTGGNSTSSASLAVTGWSGGSLAAGSTGIIVIAADNAVASGAINFPATVTDSVGNTWTRRLDISTNATANAGVELVFYSSYLSTGISSSDNVTITYSTSNVTAKAWTLSEVAPATSGNVMEFRDASTGTALSSSATPSVATGGPGNFNGLFLMCGGAIQHGGNTWTGDSDTTNGSWSSAQQAAFGTTTSGMSVVSQYKTLTAAGGQTFNPVPSVTTNNGLAYAQFQEVPPKTRLVGSNNAAGQTTTTITFDKPLTAGSTAVLCGSADNANTGGNVGAWPSTITTGGNTWTLRQNGVYNPGSAANSACELATYTSVLASNINAGDQLGITWGSPSAPTAKAYCVFEFSDATAYSTGGTGTGATTATPSVTTSSINNNDYVVGVAGLEGEVLWTPDTGTTNGTWSSAVMASAGTGTSGQSVIAQYKKVTATGTQTFAPTISTSTDSMIQWTQLTGAGVTQGSGAFFQMWP